MSGSGPQLVVLLRRLPAGPGSMAPGLLGGCERAALAAALHLRAELGGTLTALALGPAEPELPVLRAALAAGCDRALCVSPGPADMPADGDTLDGEVDDLDELDTLGVAEILAAALRRTGCDVLLCGDGPTPAAEASAAPRRAAGMVDSALGPAVAERLDMGHLTGVVAVSRGDRPGTIVAEHRGDGKKHRFRCALPVTLCVLAHPPMDAPGDLEAVDPARVEHLAVSKLAMDPGALDRSGPIVASPVATAPRQPAVMVQSAAELVARLVEDHVLR